ncbi:Zinc finger SWIM domain-containing protein 7 [Trichinella nativa]|uniref:Zinc finger SWIM domain-containing protein 7 n=1 Tax=Trichinella nativa TaxID=6335 RepID=A0A0V1LN26_9BILA|nr:Zinc finger SWIM domain-containing protein 7 [Trichinella nativa]
MRKKKENPKKSFLFNDGISRDGDSQNWDEHKFRYGLESSVFNRCSAGAGVFHPYNLPRNLYPFFVFHTLDCGHIYGPDLFVVEARYQSDGMIADEIMLAMSAVFDSQTVLESFNLVDRNSICRLVSSSGKILFQVVDEDDTAWLVLPKVNYCKCEFFANEVLYGHFQICKHVLAVWLASAVGRLHHRSIDDKIMTTMLNQLIE